MVKRKYGQAFGGRTRSRTYKRRRTNHRKGYGKRTKYYRRKKPINRFLLRRNQGRKTYGNRTIILRSNTHHTGAFTNDENLDFIPKGYDLNAPGKWFPQTDEIDELQKAKFNNSGAKRLVSIHVYMKNIVYTEFTQAEGSIVTAPDDNNFFTYYDMYNQDVIPVDNHWMISNGKRATLTRGRKKFHTVFKLLLNARSNVTSNAGTLATSQLSTILGEMNVYNKTSDGNSPISTTFYYVPQSALGILGTSFNPQGYIRYELVVATKWRLYGSETKQIANRVRRALPDQPVVPEGPGFGGSRTPSDIGDLSEVEQDEPESFEP